MFVLKLPTVLPTLAWRQTMATVGVYYFEAKNVSPGNRVYKKTYWSKNQDGEEVNFRS